MPISSHELSSFLSHSKIFVECGSAAQGHGIAAALQANFDKVYSVEIDFANYQHCKALFGHDPRVELTHGDCGVWLDKTLDKIAQPCITYFDANGYVHETESPFHASVNAMVRHGAKHHIILVDDMNHGQRHREELLSDLRRSKESGGSHEIMQQLLRINSDYIFYLLDTHTEDYKTTYASWVLCCDVVKGRFPAMSDAEYV